jgi:hypothetical protein
MSAPVTVPYRWVPRLHNRALLEVFDGGCRRIITVRHRRSGKSTDAVVITVRAAWARIGTYFIICPTYAQGRKVYWDGTTHDGRRLLLGYIPRELIASISENEMQVVLVNGSVIQVVGADQPDRLRGTNPVGVTFDEYSMMPSAECWDIVRPVLAENGGWALFAFTPRGRNHAWQLYEMARTNPEWFTQRLTVSDTWRDATGEDGTPIIPERVVDADRLEGMTEELVQQEYYCSFAAAVAGAVYGPQMAAVETEGRVRPVPYDPRQRVVTAWDIGKGTTAIIFAQTVYETVRIIDYLELKQDDLAAAVKAIQQKPYVYAQRHIGPHDLEHGEWGAGRSRVATAQRLGVHFRVLPKTSIDEGVHAARMLLPRCVFDEGRAQALIAALSHYEREWDEVKKIMAVKPRADWASHGADAFRYLAMGLRDPADERPELRKPYTAKHTFDPLDPHRDRQPSPQNRGWDL